MIPCTPPRVETRQSSCDIVGEIIVTPLIHVFYEARISFGMKP
jgi:hypothetical protein